MKEIMIYGEVVPYQSKQYCGNGYCNLSYVREQLSEAGGRDVRVRINCFGGDVEEGFAIYSELRRYAKENGARVVTLAEGRCASIATVIFLAGDERIVTEYTELFVHNAWLYVEGNSSALERAGKSLEYCNDRIAGHYEAHTNLTYEEARGLMECESFISPRDCVEMRFATGIEDVSRPSARYIMRRMERAKEAKNKVNKNNKTMSKKNRKPEEAFRKFKSGMKALFSGGSGAVNKLVVYTATEDELNFPELGEDDVVKVGDSATLDGSPAEGEIVMAGGEVYVFEGGKLVEIIGDEEEGFSGGIYDRLNLAEEAIVELLDRVQGLAIENKRLVSVLNRAGGDVPTRAKQERAGKDSVANRRGLTVAIEGLKNRKIKN